MKDSVYFCTFTEEQITNVSIEDIRNIVIECVGKFFQDDRSHIIDILKSVILHQKSYSYILFHTLHTFITKKVIHCDRFYNLAFDKKFRSNYLFHRISCLYSKSYYIRS